MRWIVTLMVVGVWGCGGGSCPEPAAPATAAEPAPAAAPAEPAAPAAKAEPAEVAPASVDAPAPEAEQPETADADADDDALPLVGVAACDEYVSKMMACLESDQFPEAARVETKKAFRQVVEQWKDMPEEAKEDLGLACTAALDAARKSFKDLGCTL